MTHTKSFLNKKTPAVLYHCMRRSVDAGIVTMDWIKSQDNLADEFTKFLKEVPHD